MSSLIFKHLGLTMLINHVSCLATSLFRLKHDLIFVLLTTKGQESFGKMPNIMFCTHVALVRSLDADLTNFPSISSSSRHYGQQWTSNKNKW